MRCSWRTIARSYLKPTTCCDIYAHYACVADCADAMADAWEDTVVVTYAHYACVADCADAMADAWEDTAGCAQPICLHENLLK